MELFQSSDKLRRRSHAFPRLSSDGLSEWNAEGMCDKIMFSAQVKVCDGASTISSAQDRETVLYKIQAIGFRCPA